MIKRLCIIGVGLIGGSLARALREANYCEEVVGCGRDTDHLQRAVDLGVIDRFSTHIPDVVKGADMVVLAVPMQSMLGVLEQLKDHLADGAVLTDVGSAKSNVVEAVRQAFGQVPDFFIPGHPIAGTEKSGVEASFAQLFQGRRVILTPMIESARTAYESVHRMWEAAGAEVVDMGLHHHDEVLAATSHLPHILAYTLVDTLARMDESEEIFRYAAGGFRDFTRIASSDPVMWRDIALTNRDQLLLMIERFSAELDRFSDLLRMQDEEEITATFKRAKQARDRFTQRDKRSSEK